MGELNESYAFNLLGRLFVEYARHRPGARPGVPIALTPGEFVEQIAAELRYAAAAREALRQILGAVHSSEPPACLDPVPAATAEQTTKRIGELGRWFHLSIEGMLAAHEVLDEHGLKHRLPKENHEFTAMAEAHLARRARGATEQRRDPDVQVLRIERDPDGYVRLTPDEGEPG